MYMKKKTFFRLTCLATAFTFLWTTCWASSEFDRTALTLEELKKRYPNASFHQMSMEEYRRAKQRIANGNTYVAQISEGENTFAAFARKPYTADDILRLCSNWTFFYVQMCELSSTAYKKGNEAFFVVSEESELSGKIVENRSFSKKELKKTFSKSKLYRLSRAEINGSQNCPPKEMILVAIPMPEPVENPNEPAENPAEISGQIAVPAKDCSDCLGSLPSDDVAAVVFVVIGVVVIAFFVVYAVAYLTNAAVHGEERDFWWEIGARATAMGDDDDDEKEMRHVETGVATGLLLAAGPGSKDFQIGLGVEAGYMYLDTVYDEHTRLEEPNGMYGMAGPVIRMCWGDNNPNYFLLELLAGTSSHDEIGIISTARAGLNFGVSEHFRIGLNGGSFYYNLKESENLFQETDDFMLLFGVEMGYRF